MILNLKNGMNVNLEISLNIWRISMIWSIFSDNIIKEKLWQ